jgi:hypothetical protein
MKHQPEIAFHPDCDALSHAAQLAHCPALHIHDGRLRGSKQKGARQADALERLAHDARIEGRDVSDNVRQFRHFLLVLQMRGIDNSLKVAQAFSLPLEFLHFRREA